MKDCISILCKKCGLTFTKDIPSLKSPEPKAPSYEEMRFLSRELDDEFIQHLNQFHAPKPDRCKCGEDRLVLKWGTLKEWHFHSDEAERLLKQYYALGASASAAMQRDNERQKEIICELIDECNGKIFDDWSGKKLSKKAAKKYVREY